jgi:dTMP kinase
VFLTFEGLDGTGKSTQIERLRAYLAQIDRPAYWVREPGGTDLGERIRELVLSPLQARAVPTAETLLMSAARAQLVSLEIQPRLSRVELVICYRFADSTIAYQGFGRGMDRNAIGVLTKFATGGICPDLTILLDLDERESARRLATRMDSGCDHGDDAQNANFFDHIDFDFRRRVRDGYLQLAAASPERWRVVDAALSAETVFEQIRELVLARLEQGGTP